MNVNYNKFITEYNKKCPNYNYKPAIMPAVERIVVLGDIHGDYKLAINMLLLSKVIKVHNNNHIEWIGGQTCVVQVGDQIDKCRPDETHKCDRPDGTYNDEQSDLKILKLFTYIDGLANKVGGSVYSLLGNHEIMNAEGNTSYASYQGNMEFKNFIVNGKKIRSGKRARMLAFAPGNEIGTFLGCTRYSALIIGSNLFVHAGIVNGLISELKLNDKSNLNKIDIAIRMWLLGSIDKKYINKIIAANDTSLFWTRVLGRIPPNTPLNDSRCINHINGVMKLFNVGNIVIGHTPQSFSYSDDINGTCDNKIWRVDNGSSEAFTFFDEQFIETGKTQHSRRVQILEIINDTVFNVCSLEDNNQTICKNIK